jgi:hypothetical protein
MAPKFFQCVLVALVRSEMASTTARACDVVVLSSMCLGVMGSKYSKRLGSSQYRCAPVVALGAYSRVIHYHLSWLSTPALQ